MFNAKVFESSVGTFIVSNTLGDGSMSPTYNALTGIPTQEMAQKIANTLNETFWLGRKEQAKRIMEELNPVNRFR